MAKKKTTPLTNERAREIWEALIKSASQGPSAAAELDALLPAILDQAFKGEL